MTTPAIPTPDEAVKWQPDGGWGVPISDYRLCHAALQTALAQLAERDERVAVLHEIIARARNDAGGNMAILIANGSRKVQIVLPLPEHVQSLSTGAKP